MTGPRGELPILPVGTQVVTTVDLRGNAGGVRVPRGALGTILKAPADGTHSYWVRLVDGAEHAFTRAQLATLARFQDHELAPAGGRELFGRVILQVIVGSRAYGLHGDDSDTDRRGVYLPPAELHWSLHGVPEQIDDEPAQAIFWELQKFLVMGLKANPSVLECLWSPLLETCTPLGRELLALRGAFLSRLVFQTYSGYVASQFRKIEADWRQRGEPKWKHVMHLLRLLAAGVDVLRTGEVPVDVGEGRARLLAVRRGEVPWPEVEAWRLELHEQFTAAAQATRLPERPDYDTVDAFLRRARRLALAEALP
ncbi:MAG TPA: nucleotidyltransferase domain-containing protein [Planctomycetota bacterium]|nr:nucleotidyltransferase domain-containing protein [Planctomycetota bacterium]